MEEFFKKQISKLVMIVVLVIFTECPVRARHYAKEATFLILSSSHNILW